LGRKIQPALAAGNCYPALPLVLGVTLVQKMKDAARISAITSLPADHTLKENAVPSAPSEIGKDFRNRERESLQTFPIRAASQKYEKSRNFLPHARIYKKRKTAMTISLISAILKENESQFREGLANLGVKGRELEDLCAGFSDGQSAMVRSLKTLNIITLEID
jgi:hypothetical protein